MEKKYSFLFLYVETAVGKMTNHIVLDVFSSSASVVMGHYSIKSTTNEAKMQKTVNHS